MIKIFIPEEELQFDFARSSGSGGQNINKRSTKAQLWWHIGSSIATISRDGGLPTLLSEEEKQLIRDKADCKITANDEIFLQSEKERTQEGNRRDVISRLHAILEAALKPKKTRKETKVPRKEKEHRLEEKRRESRKKELRRIEW